MPAQSYKIMVARPRPTAAATELPEFVLHNYSAAPHNLTLLDLLLETLLARITPSSTPARLQLRHLQPLCLALLARQAASGYDLMATLSALPLFAQARPDAPGVYRTLQAFETRGLVAGRRCLSKKGPARREYTLTPAGHTCLLHWHKTLSSAREELDAVISLVQQEKKKPDRAAGQRSYKPERLVKKGRSGAIATQHEPQREISKPRPVPRPVRGKRA